MLGLFQEYRYIEPGTRVEGGLGDQEVEGLVASNLGQQELVTFHFINK